MERLRRGKVCVVRFEAKEIRHIWGVDPAFSPYEEPGNVLLVSEWLIEGSPEAAHFCADHSKTEGCYEVRVTAVERQWIDPTSPNKALM